MSWRENFHRPEEKAGVFFIYIATLQAHTLLPDQMKIAVNARFLLKDRLEGIGRFSHETLQLLVKAHPEHTFLLIFDRAYHPDFVYAENVVPVTAFPQARHPLLYYWWFEWSLPRIFNTHKPDVFLSPDGFLSLRTQVPSIPVIHDLAFEHYPQYVSRTGALYYRHFFPQFAAKASRIATVSEYTRSDLVAIYGCDPGKIDVVYNGVSGIFSPLDKEGQAATRATYAGNAPYFVFVGALQPRKNISNMLRAFDLFRKTTSSNIKLVIVGRKAWQTDQMEEIFSGMQFAEDVIFTGRLPDAELSKVMASALALVYVPFFEGFGLPVAEAFCCGIPVITSDNSSLPEVAGDAALFADPESVESIAAQFSEMAFNSGKRGYLLEKAKERSTVFTWQKTATRLWKTIEKTLEEL